MPLDQDGAVRRLKRLASEWPNDLWLFASGPGLHVMKCDDNGQRAYLPNGGVDPDYIVETIAMPVDGGDW